MDWDTIRQHYAEHVAALKQQHITQTQIAARGGLAGQNAVSKLLTNRRRGPSVETFIRAVLGLGLPVSQFFAELERRPFPPGAIPASEAAVLSPFGGDHDRPVSSERPSPLAVAHSAAHAAHAAHAQNKAIFKHIHVLERRLERHLARYERELARITAHGEQALREAAAAAAAPGSPLHPDPAPEDRRSA